MLQISFRLARPGFMRDFSGTWCVRPFDNASLDALVNKHTPSPLHRLQSSLRAVEQSLGLGATQAESLVVLQQSIAPALAPPPALAKMLQRIAAKQVGRGGWGMVRGQALGCSSLVHAARMC
jgi:hypothetical protein